MFDWYTRFYDAVRTSRANALYNARLAGRDLGQHDFVELAHLDHLIKVSGLTAGGRALDLGCGVGFIAEYLSDQSGARMVGIDFIPEAIRQAQARTASKQARLSFQVMDMARLDFPPASFDLVIAIDTLYFTDPVDTVGQIKRLLAPGGRLAAFYSYGREPWVPREEFPVEATHPDATPLARALQQHDLPYTYVDYTQADYHHALRKAQIAEALKADFEAEGNLFLYENHIGEARGVRQAIEEGAHRRYLYLASAAAKPAA